MTTASRSRLAAERARESDVCSYHPPALSIPDLRSQLGNGSDTTLPPPTHGPRPSQDAVLTALAQLGALRLNAAHALVSLVDSQSQIVLAEATQNTPLSGAADALWLGSAVIPRACGVCEHVLDEPALIVDDLLLDARFQSRSFVQSAPHFRFYAGVPLKTPTGSVIGVYSIFDTSPRHGIAETQLQFLQDVAAAVVSYLGVSKAHDTNRKAEHMIRGLASFVTGAADLQGSTELDMPRAPENPSLASPLPPRTPQLEGYTTPSDESQGTEQEEDLQDSILPSGAKRMFARAANIMRESSALSGVIFFDASMANTQPTGHTPPQTSSDDSDTEIGTIYATSNAEESSGSNPSSSSSTSHQPTCKILGFADSSRSSRDGSRIRKDYLMLTESSLRKFLMRHPHGKIFNIARQTTDDIPMKRSKKGITRRSTAVDAIIDVAHNARSAAIIPLWDYNRQRWFAGCLCWVTDPRRVLTYGSDLLYLRGFGQSIMAEMSRIDAAAVDKARTTFIESMSHELRSPLHGILGGVEYLQSMQLDTFQANVVYSISMCGRTLLDTVQNVLEYSKINEFTGPYAKSASSGALRLRRSSTGPLGSNPSIDLRRLTEETVEAIFAGQSYNLASPQPNDEEDYFSDGASPVTPLSKSTRKAVRVVLDLPARDSWTFGIQPGIWRRILMNVFGNALRFTETGFVRVALFANDISDTESELLLTISDSGIGMSAKYVQDGLFKPFSQENPFSVGTGLGMSIVQRLVQSLGGEVTVKSKVRSGTTVQIRVVLSKRIPVDDDFEFSVAARARGMNVAVIRNGILEGRESRELLRASEGQFHDCLTDNLRTWFGVNVSTSRDNIDDYSSQLVIYPGPSFNSIFKLRKRRGVSVVIAVDGIEAATLRTDPRIKSGWIEVITQPCGPSKLARILDRYMSRLDPESNAPLRPDITISPAPGIVESNLPFRRQSTSPQKSPNPRTSSASEPASKEDDDHSVHETPTPLPHQPAQTQNPSASISSNSSSSVATPPSNSSTASQLYHRQMHDEMEKQRSLLTPPPAVLPSIAITASRGNNSKKDILIVDDNPLNLRLLSAFLTKAGFERHTSAPNGLEALNLFKQDPKRWAAVLMDISMPVMDGVTATREIRAWEQRINPAAVDGESGGGSRADQLRTLKRSTSSEDSKETVRRWNNGAAGAGAGDELLDEASSPPAPDEESEGEGKGDVAGADVPSPAASPLPVSSPDDEVKGDNGDGDGDGDGDSPNTEQQQQQLEEPAAQPAPTASPPLPPGMSYVSLDDGDDPPSDADDNDHDHPSSCSSSPPAPPLPEMPAGVVVAESPTPTAMVPFAELAADRVQIIVITGLGSATARFEAINAGADVFMTKPIKFGMLMKTLRGRVAA